MENLSANQEGQMLQIFQVEELEKRFEMGEWAVSTSSTTNTSTGQTTITVGASHKF